MMMMTFVKIGVMKLKTELQLKTISSFESVVGVYHLYAGLPSELSKPNSFIKQYPDFIQIFLYYFAR